MQGHFPGECVQWHPGAMAGALYSSRPHPCRALSPWG